MKVKQRTRNRVLAGAALGFLLLAGTSLYGQQTFGTTVYLDYTHYLSNDGPLTKPPAGSTNFMNNFFTFRRGYFTYENKVTSDLKFRFRFDADYVKAVDSSGKKDDKLRPFMKHIYLEWANILPKSVLRVGMTETLTFKLAEDRWGYRSVAKTLADGYKDITGKEIDTTSADIGASFTGTLAKQLRYGFMVANGAGYSHPEGDKFKKVSGLVQVIPVSGLSLVGYADYEKQTADAEALTYKADAYFEMIKGVVLGAEYLTYRNDLNKLGNGTKYDANGWSVFGRAVIMLDKLNAFARYDRYDPNSETNKDETSLVIAGLDWTPTHASFKLQPNVWYYTYADSAKKDDLIFNLTFFLSF